MTHIFYPWVGDVVILSSRGHTHKHTHTHTVNESKFNFADFQHNDIYGFTSAVTNTATER